MKMMKDIKDNYEQGKKSRKCEGIPKNVYCRVFNKDIDLKPVEPFVYEDDPVHRSYVQKELKKL